jgi:hypothetical protein
MFDFSGLAISSSDWVSWGGILFLVIVAKATRSETRTLMAGVMGAILVPSPATPFVIICFALVFKLFDALKVD